MSKSFFAFCAAFCLLFTQPSMAEPLTFSAQQGWHYKITGALYAPVQSRGTSTINGTSADFELNLRDALKVLDFTATGRFEAWNGRFGLIAEGHYLGISENGETVAGGEVVVDVDQSWIGLLAAYRVSEGSLSNGQAFSFDVQGGARYNRIQQKINSTGPAALDLGGTKTWWEPVVGARFSWGMSEKWSGSVLVDAGGFGVNGNDLQWSATLGFEKKFNDQTALVFGWRYYEIDYSTSTSTGTFGYDVSQTGPFIGISHQFN